MVFAGFLRPFCTNSKENVASFRFVARYCSQVCRRLSSESQAYDWNKWEIRQEDEDSFHLGLSLPQQSYVSNDKDKHTRADVSDSPRSVQSRVNSCSGGYSSSLSIRTAVENLRNNYKHNEELRNFLWTPRTTNLVYESINLLEEKGIVDLKDIEKLSAAEAKALGLNLSAAAQAKALGLNLSAAEAKALFVTLRPIKVLQSFYSELLQSSYSPLEKDHKESEVLSGDINISGFDSGVSGSAPVKAVLTKTIDSRYSSHLNAVEASKVVPFHATRVTKGKKPQYSLLAKHTPPVLAATIKSFHKFMTEPFYGSIEPRLSETTAQTYVDITRAFMGWYILHRADKDILLSNKETDELRVGKGPFSDVPLRLIESVRIEHILPSETFNSGRNVFDFMEFLRTERSASVSYQQNVLRALIKFAKFRFHEDIVKASDVFREPDPYNSSKLIKELRKMLSDMEKKAKGHVRVSNENKKWLDWPEYLEVVEFSRKEQSNDFWKCGTLRSAKSKALAQQKYLILAIFACIPDRQRTLRELEIGNTLQKVYFDNDRAKKSDNPHGYDWVIKHGPEDYKTGKIYGERPPLIIDPSIYSVLEEFIDENRCHLIPEEGNNYLFVNRYGKQMQKSSIYNVVARQTYKVTGKRMNPHLIRDSMVTHFAQTNASDTEREALALFMGHSVQTQKETYDRRTKVQKVAPAVDLIRTINKGHLKG